MRGGIAVLVRNGLNVVKHLGNEFAQTLVL